MTNDAINEKINELELQKTNEIEHFTEELYKENPEVSKFYISMIKKDLENEYNRKIEELKSQLKEEKKDTNTLLDSLYKTNDVDNFSINEIFEATNETKELAHAVNEELKEKFKERMLEERKISEKDLPETEKVVFEEEFTIPKKTTLEDLVNTYYESEIPTNNGIDEEIKEQEHKVLEYLNDNTKLK